jgi:hypothetical protein
MMRELYPTEIADMPPWMSSLEWQAQQWVKYGGIWYQYKRKDNEWWSKKDEHTDAQKLNCPPPWWEIAAHWASVHDVPVADMDLVDTPDGLVWHDRVRKQLDQEIWSRLRRLHKWLGGGYQPSYATDLERRQMVWFKLQESVDVGDVRRVPGHVGRRAGQASVPPADELGPRLRHGGRCGYQAPPRGQPARPGGAPGPPRRGRQAAAATAAAGGGHGEGG